LRTEVLPVFNSILLLKHGNNAGIAVCIPKETILKEIAAKVEYVKAAFFNLVWELSSGTSYNCRCISL
jgi:hypothetical protein